MPSPDLEDVPTDDLGRPAPPAPSLEGPEWDQRRALTPAEEEDAWKIARLTAALMGPDGEDGSWGSWAAWEDAVRCGASLLEISRRHVAAGVDRKGSAA